MLVSSPKVLISSLMQTNSHCLPANMLLAIKRLRNGRGSEITSSIVSSVCGNQPVHIRRQETFFIRAAKKIMVENKGGKKDLEDMK